MQYKPWIRSKISKCGRCSVSFLFYFRILLLAILYFYIILHILKARYLHNLSERILREYTDDLNAPNYHEFPSRCKSFMKNCARVSFDSCQEIRTDRNSFDCVFLDRCNQMSESYQLGEKLGMNVSAFFLNSMAEVKTQANFCGRINFPTQYKFVEKTNEGVIDLINTVFFYPNRIFFKIVDCK